MINRNIKVRMRTEIETKERWDVPFLVELDEVIDQEEHSVALDQVIEEEYKGGSKKSGDAYYYIVGGEAFAEFQSDFSERNYITVNPEVVIEGDDGEYYTIKEFQDPNIVTGDLLSPKKEVK